MYAYLETYGKFKQKQLLFQMRIFLYRSLAHPRGHFHIFEQLRRFGRGITSTQPLPHPAVCLGKYLYKAVKIYIRCISATVHCMFWLQYHVRYFFKNSIHPE